MINLVYPSSLQNRYACISGLLIGPIDQSGKWLGESISFDGKASVFQQSQGMYHDNNVEHDKLVGEFNYLPIILALTPVPTTAFPFAQSFPNDIWNYKRTMNGGYAVGMEYYFATGIGVNNANSHSVWYPDPTSTLLAGTLYTVISSPLNPYTLTSATRTKVIFKGVNSYYPRCDFYQWYGAFQPVASSGVDWRQIQNASTVMAACARVTAPTGSPSTTWYDCPKLVWPKGSIQPTPASMKAQVSAYVANVFEGLSFPIKETHYGELAHVASTKANRNHVNMIAFLRDLRHPTQMIPKLKNLRHLKGLASNFLSVKYGLLPTADDLTSIVEAFRRAAPFLDRNGFTCLTADRRASLVEGHVTYTMEQHIKLAIANEDDEFQKLLEQLESWGVLPTFENVWDLIPYTFALDWFVDVGALLERVDTRLRLMRLNVKYVTMSRKKTMTGARFTPDQQLPFVGAVDWVHYHRWVTDHCPVPPLSLQPNPSPTNHWLEGGALIIQRL